MAAAIADGLVTEYLQLEPRPFEGRWTVVRLPSMVVQLARENIANVHRLRVPLDRWAFVVPLAGSSRWDGREVAPGALIVCPPGSESFAFDHRGTVIALASLDSFGSDDIVTAARALAGRLAASRVFMPESSAGHDLRFSLTKLGAAAERATGKGRDLLGSRDTAVRRHLLNCLKGLADQGCLPERDSARGHVVRCADDFIRRHAGEVVSIGQLSMTAGVSERSLRNAFRDVCTTSPKRYLKLWQLHQVRRTLRTFSNDAITVTHAATLFGIFELGRFAGEYKALFGEAPSDTLRLRARTQTSHWTGDSS